MTLEEKQDLSRLLRRCQEDLLEANNSNIELRAEIDNWLDENIEPVPQPTIKELLAKYTPEELRQILREELAIAGVDPDDANAVQEILQPINWNAASVTS